jgi:hypothetical protein
MSAPVRPSCPSCSRRSQRWWCLRYEQYAQRIVAEHIISIGMCAHCFVQCGGLSGQTSCSPAQHEMQETTHRPPAAAVPGRPEPPALPPCC